MSTRTGGVRPANRRRRPRTVANAYQRLETRNLLATFNGTVNDDTVVIDFVDGRPATIELNGEPTNNPDDTMTLNLDRGFDKVELNGATFDVELKNVPLMGNQAVINGGALTINWLSSLDLTTDSGDDTIRDLGMVDFIYVRTGEGNDVVEYRGSLIRASLGAGDDSFTTFTGRQSGHSYVSMEGGEGFDTWNVATNDDLRLFGGVYYHDPFDPFYADFDTFFQSRELGIIGYDLENIEAPEVNEGDKNEFVVSTSGQVFIDGTTNRFQFFKGQTLIYAWLNNFNELTVNTSIHDPTIPVGQVIASVHSTAYEMVLDRMETVVLGGNFLQGSTDLVQHKLRVYRAQTLNISDSSSELPHNVFVSKIQETNEPEGTHHLLGLTPKAVLYSDVKTINLSSSQHDDVFYVSESPAHLILFGNHGNDRFRIGMNQNDSVADLGITGSFVSVVGGEGTDSVLADDSGNQTQRHFRLRDRWLTRAGTSPDEEFQGIWFASMEDFHLKANENSDRFYTTPSQVTRFLLAGGSTSQPFNQTYLSVPPIPVERYLINGDNFYTWYFFDTGFKNIWIRK